MLNPKNNPALTTRAYYLIGIGLVFVLLGVFTLRGGLGITSVAFGVAAIIIGSLFLPPPKKESESKKRSDNHQPKGDDKELPPPPFENSSFFHKGELSTQLNNQEVKW